MLRIGDCCCGRARGYVATAGVGRGRVLGLLWAAVHRAPPRCFERPALLVARIARCIDSACVSACRSRTGAKFSRRARLIRKKIIGRSVSRFAAPIAGMSAFVGSIRRACGRCPAIRLLESSGMLALPHQPARQHGRGIFFEPGIQQLRDLFAEIRGMAEPRKFVALQRIARSREQELPGRLGFVRGQGGLQGNTERRVP